MQLAGTRVGFGTTKDYLVSAHVNSSSRIKHTNHFLCLVSRAIDRFLSALRETVR